MKNIKSDILEAIHEAASEAASEVLQETLDNLSVNVDSYVADDIIQQYLSDQTLFTADDLNAIVQATFLAATYLQALDGATRAFEIEAEGVQRGGVPVFSAEGMKHVYENMIRQVTEVGKKAADIRDALDASL